MRIEISVKGTKTRLKNNLQNLTASRNEAPKKRAGTKGVGILHFGQNVEMILGTSGCNQCVGPVGVFTGSSG